MATAKPKTKRMMFGGMAKGPAKPPMRTQPQPAPMRTQSQMQAAAKTQQAGRTPPPPSGPTPLQWQQIAQRQAGPKPSAPPPAMAKAYADMQAQRSGATGTGSQRVMKKGGAVKKATKK